MKGIMTNFLKIDMKDEQIRVFYKMKEQINSEFDKELQALCEKYGFKWWASGFDLEERIRDIAFEKEEGLESPWLEDRLRQQVEEVPSGGQAPSLKLVKKDKLPEPLEILFEAVGNLEKRIKGLEAFQMLQEVNEEE